MSSTTPYSTIVVGTDGSETSLRAVDHAGGLAGTNGARLVIVTAYEPLHNDEVKAAAVALKEDAHLVRGATPAETRRPAAAARAPRAGAEQVETLALRGEPVAVLEMVAAQTNAD